MTRGGGTLFPLCSHTHLSPDSCVEGYQDEPASEQERYAIRPDRGWKGGKADELSDMIAAYSCSNHKLLFSSQTGSKQSVRGEGEVLDCRMEKHIQVSINCRRRLDRFVRPLSGLQQEPHLDPPSAAAWQIPHAFNYTTASILST